MSKKKIGLFIGRMSLPHFGHKACIEQMTSECDESIILIGSSRRSLSLKNPFTYEERKSIVKQWVNPDVSIYPLEDSPYCNNAWIHSVQQHVYMKATGNYSRGPDDVEVRLYHGDKESPDSYTSFFPDYKKIAVPSCKDGSTIIHASDLRKALFEGSWQDLNDMMLPIATKRFLDAWLHSIAYAQLKGEYEFVKSYKASWASAPYEPTFVTVDACVVQSGHVALIQRKDSPGKGLWALPGGFLNPKEKIFDACIRELVEETGIKVPEKVLRASLANQGVFDDPDRSERGRTITHAFKFQLKDELELPHIKGMDDAAKARWFPMHKVFEMRDQMYEDHYFIIRFLMGF